GVGEYYIDSALNYATVGVYSEAEVALQWWNGEISDDEASGAIGATGVLQLATAWGMRSARTSRFQTNESFTSKTDLGKAVRESDISCQTRVNEVDTPLQEKLPAACFVAGTKVVVGMEEFNDSGAITVDSAQYNSDFHYTKVLASFGISSLIISLCVGMRQVLKRRKDSYLCMEDGNDRTTDSRNKMKLTPSVSWQNDLSIKYGNKISRFPFSIFKKSRGWLSLCFIICICFLASAWYNDASTLEVNNSNKDKVEVYSTEHLFKTRYITKNIEDVKKGDLVLAYDHEAQRTVQSRVLSTSCIKSDHIRLLTIVDARGDRQIIKTTDSHPFWILSVNPSELCIGEEKESVFDVDKCRYIDFYRENIDLTSNGGYVDAKNIKVGSALLDVCGNEGIVVNNRTVVFPKGIDVYNISTADYHNYFVHSANSPNNYEKSYLVHNADRCNLSIDNKRHFDENQNALIELAKEIKKRGVRNSEVEILEEWSYEYRLPFMVHRKPVKGEWLKPHIHIKPVNHIEIIDD
ncbi:MAG: hypothetical protein IJU03_10755, partial [Thermoguttaceae bacterium]|nr:hypothetical protein [Thermoguttaceae bacterium]